MRFHFGISFSWKQIKKLIIPILIAIGLLFSNLQYVHAESIPEVLYGVKNVTVNGTQLTQTFVTSPTPVPLMFSQTGATNYFSLNSMSFSFDSPVTGNARSYSITLSYKVNFTSAVAYGLSYSTAVELPKSFVKFEQGVIDTQSQKTTITNVNTNSFVVEHTAVVTLTDTVALSTIVASLNSDSLILGCSSSGSSTSKPCPADGVIPLQLTNVVAEITISEDINNTLLNGINNSINNQTTVIEKWFNNLNEDINNALGSTNESLDNIEDSITNDNVDTENADGFFTNFENKDYGLSDIVKAPLVLIQGLTSGTSCQNLEFNVLGKDVSMPSGCILWDKVPESIETIYFVFIGGFLAYILGTNLFHDVNDLKNPEKNEVSTLDL